MNILVITIGFLCLCGALALAIVRVAQKARRNAGHANVTVMGRGSVIIWTIIGLILVLLGQSFVIIPTGHVGVPIRMSQVVNCVYPPGFVPKIPFADTIDTIDVKLQDANFAEYDGIYAECSDKLPILTNNIRVTYQISSDAESILWLKHNITDIYSIVSEISVSSALETSTVKFNSVEVSNRALLEPAVKSALQDIVDTKYGDGRIEIIRVLIGKIEYEESFVQAINEKNKAQQAYEQAQVQNKQALEKAQNDAAIRRTEAEGKAEAAKIEAEGIAEANRLINASLNDMILANNWIIKWDGKMPLVTDSSGNIVDISALLGGADASE